MLRLIVRSVLLAGLVACADGDRTTVTPRVAVPVLVGAIDGFNDPRSARYDAARDVWFISNAGGATSDKDGNGYISRVSGDLNTVDTLFIAGGSGDVVLHSPKGMTVAGDTLWVADIDAVRGFDVTTGAPLVSIEVPGAVFLSDAVRGQDGALYITDTGIHAGPGGQSQPGPGRVFRIDGREVTEVLRFDEASGPSSIAVDAERGRMLLVANASPVVHSWVAGAPRADSIAAGPGGYNGVVILADGRALISSWTDSSVHVLAGDSLAPFLRGVAFPSDMGVDTTRGYLGVRLAGQGRVEFWTIPAR